MVSRVEQTLAAALVLSWIMACDACSSDDILANHGGWPCFREDAQGRWLAGISSKATGEEPSCVSTYFHRDWLRSGLQRSAKHGG
jgi:hypothetical protein